MDVARRLAANHDTTTMNSTELLNQVHALRAKAARIEELARRHEEIEEELRDITGVDRVAIPYSAAPSPELKTVTRKVTRKRYLPVGSSPLEHAILDVLKAGREMHCDEIRRRLRAFPHLHCTDAAVGSRLCNMKKRGILMNTSFGFYQAYPAAAPLQTEDAEDTQEHVA